MIVEDEILIAEDLHASLSGMGYTVTSIVSSGEEAVIRAGSERPDLIMMDIHLRGSMDGITATEKIFATYRIPVIFLSAFSGQDLYDRTKDSGAFGYLIKPFNDEELKAAIETTLNKAKNDDLYREIEQRAMQIQKQQSVETLIGGLAHNFNNLLSIILGNIDWALQELPADQPAVEALQEAMTATERAANLSNKLLIYLGMVPGKMATVNLVSNVVQLMDIFRNLAHEKINIKFNSSEDQVFIRCDIALFDQLILNLVENAIEAIGSQAGTITVTIGKEYHTSFPHQHGGTGEKKELSGGEFGYFEVTDNGCGMEATTLERAFEPFFTTKFTGRGMGLSAAQGIAKIHGGMVILQSNPSRGETSAKVFIPSVSEPI
jgi:signal transduction histidine kinase